GLLFQIMISLLFAVIAFVRNPKHLGKLLFTAAVSYFALIILQQVEFINTATEAFLLRFENASADEGGLQGTLVNRFLMGMFGSVFNTGDLPFFGYGLGLGTNVGSQLTTGDRQFLIAEDEWPRLIGEIGPLLGLLLIAIRLSFGFQVFIGALRKLKAGDYLPWMLLSFGLLLIVQGGWAQPTSLGFCTIVAGMLVAALRDENAETASLSTNEEPEPIGNYNSLYK
ncbi:MAG TPA: hypothetical protein VK664_15425, partial [Flavitalea sp.]|nr:hypothetical protein [Flavitalea sp.]